MLQEEKKLILILGGSTFMGKHLLKLLSQDESYEVHFINRGKKYWDNEVIQIKNVHFTYGNRDELGDYKKLLSYLSSKLGIKVGGRKWEAVIDFCCFQSKQVQIVYEALQTLTNLYIYISTDSIYDVCDREIRKEQAISEDLDIRPIVEQLYEQYKEEEEYGHDKLKCEEFLKYNIKNKTDFPFISLRLPDVFGPYDDTGRFWAYIKWIQAMDQFPLQLDTFCRTKPLCFVYSEDVADIIIKILNEKLYTQEQIINQSYNICCNEAVPILDFLQLIVLSYLIYQNQAKYMNIHQLNITDQDKASKFYPSVECGPISNLKSKQLLHVQMTPLETCIQKTVAFFMNIKKGQYETENEKAEKKFTRKLSNK